MESRAATTNSRSDPAANWDTMAVLASGEMENLARLDVEGPDSAEDGEFSRRKGDRSQDRGACRRRGSPSPMDWSALGMRFLYFSRTGVGELVGEAVARAVTIRS